MNQCDPFPLPAPASGMAASARRQLLPLRALVGACRALVPARDLTPAISCVATHTSWRTCRWLGFLLGTAYFLRRRAEYQQTAERMCVELPHLSIKQARRAARRGAQMEKMRLCELLRLPIVTAQALGEYTQIEGMEHLEAAAADGRGLICPIAHFGQYELMAARLAQRFAVSATSDPFYHPVKQRYLAAARRSAGVSTFPGTGAARAVLAELREKKLVYVFADLQGGPQGMYMPVLGQRRWVQTSPARLAMAAKAPLVPMFPVRRAPWFTDGRILVKVWPPLRLNGAAHRGTPEYRAEIERGTRYFLDAFEATVKIHPDEAEFGVLMGRKG